MADNITVDEGTGKAIAADDISSIWYQRIKLVTGGDGITPKDALAGDYVPIAASQTAAIIQKSTAAQYDYLAGVLIVPASTSPGAVSIIDGSGGTPRKIFEGGSSSVSNLVPFFVPLGIVAASASATVGWHITTGANVSVICVGDFS